MFPAAWTAAFVCTTAEQKPSNAKTDSTYVSWSKRRHANAWVLIMSVYWADQGPSPYRPLDVHTKYARNPMAGRAFECPHSLQGQSQPPQSHCDFEPRSTSRPSNTHLQVSPTVSRERGSRCLFLCVAFSTTTERSAFGRTSSLCTPPGQYSTSYAACRPPPPDAAILPHTT
jgi:hypothetical protein